MITQLIEFDVKKDSHVKITAKEGDINSRNLEFRLLDNSLPFSLVGRTVRCYMVKPDKRIVFSELQIIDAEDGRCVLTLSLQSLIVSGMAKLELIIYEAGKKLSIIPIKMDIIKSLNSDKLLESTNEFGALNNALGKIDTFTASIDSKASKEDLKKLSSQLEQKAKQVDLDKTNNSLNAMRNNVFESSSKFMRMSNVFGKEQTVNPKDMIIWKSGTSNIRIITKWTNDRDMMWEIRKPSSNPNGLYSVFGALQTKVNTTSEVKPWNSEPVTAIYASSTDWLGPVIMEAINGDGSTTKAFTGGNHAHLSQPTARNIGIQILVDGVDKTNDDSVKNTNCSKVEVILTNEIKAYNTVSLNRYVLQEKHHIILHSRANEILVEVFAELTPLEEINIHTYYGIQSHTSPITLWGNSYHFVNGKTKAREQATASLNSGERGDYLCTRVVQKGNEYTLMTWLDSGYGLGTMENCDISQPCCFYNHTSNKIYFNLVKGKVLNLKANEKVYWHGGWTLTVNNIESNIDCNITKLENDKYIKVIDFISKGSYELSTSKKYLDNLVDVNGGIGINKYAYNGKINITSPSYGSIELIE